MADEHPFQLLFESFGRPPASHAEAVNREAFGALVKALEMPVDGPGRCTLLRAPRAGHGKTHLLSRTQHHLGGSHEFIPIHPAGSRVTAASVTEDVLKRLSRPLPGAGGLTVLDLIVRRLFSFALQPLVISGEVPCQDREGALAALKGRPVETFDFHHPNAVTAMWARDNFEVLGPRLSMELSQRGGVSIREVSFWVTAFFHFASTPIDHPARSSALALEVAAEPATDGIAMERLAALLGMLSLLVRVVLVADDLEGFSADEGAALRFAAFVVAVRQAVERVDVILSLNQDIWDTAFVPRLSGGLADRLSEVVVQLAPLADEDIAALLDSRVPGLGHRMMERLTGGERYARGLIKAAAEIWPVSGVSPESVFPGGFQARRSGIYLPPPPPPPPPAPRATAAQPVSNPVPDHAAEPRPAPPSQALDFDPFEREYHGPSGAAPVTGAAWAHEVAPGWNQSGAGKESSIFDDGFTSGISAQDVQPPPPPQPQFSPPNPPPPSPFQPSAMAAPEPGRVDPPSFPVNPPPATAPAYSVPAFHPPVDAPASGGAPEAAPAWESASCAITEPRTHDDRVDELLREFRERYGRGSL